MSRKFTLCRIAGCTRENNARDGLCRFHYEERRGKEAYTKPMRAKLYLKGKYLWPKPEKLKAS